MTIDWLSAIQISREEVMVGKTGDDEATIFAVEGPRPIIKVRGMNGMTAVETANYDIQQVREAAGATHKVA